MTYDLINLDSIIILGYITCSSLEKLIFLKYFFMFTNSASTYWIDSFCDNWENCY